MGVLTEWLNSLPEPAQIVIGWSMIVCGLIVFAQCFTLFNWAIYWLPDRTYKAKHPELAFFESRASGRGQDRLLGGGVNVMTITVSASGLSCVKSLFWFGPGWTIPFSSIDGIVEKRTLLRRPYVEITYRDEGGLKHHYDLNLRKRKELMHAVTELMNA